VGLDSEYRVSLDELREKLTPEAIFVVASAPSYPQGVIDPIAAVGELADERNIGLHVDACLGGFLLPFMRKLGYPLPDFDFSVKGVTSISADLHKNGYAAKGASAILYRDAELRHFQYFVDPDWTGGIYGSPTMLGTRPGGAIAAAWAAMMSLGQDGYLRLARETMDIAESLMRGIAGIPGLFIVGEPDMSVISFGAEEVPIFALAERMAEKGWRLDRQRNPDSLHIIATANHRQSIQPFLHDLAAATAAERSNPHRDQNDVSAMLYGVTAGPIADGSIDEAMRLQMDVRFESIS
jgi:glutamate/tyrosine decarboxylase-like PLP-dependent enzyme